MSSIDDAASLHADFVDESHIQAFREALHTDEYFPGDLANSPGPVPQSPTLPPASSIRVKKVSALSDFAPVNLRVKRKKKKERAHERRHDCMYLLLRWPLLLFIFIFIAAEFGLYVFIRQVVNGKEWISAWRGKKGLLRKRLRAARNYEASREWKAAARAMDEYLKFDEWKNIDEDSFYDWKLIRKVTRSLKLHREKNDVRGCMGVLETCIRANFAGIESSRLYSETFLGTKNLIESYYDEEEKALEFIRESPQLTVDEKKKFFKSANTNFGISALCLSGGASFGYYHVGVIKAFVEADLLPRVITGTSAGGLIAALVCTRREVELKSLLVPELANRITACEEPFVVWGRRFWKTGARFDSVLWARKATFFTMGSLTFAEAFARTGRILNISVIPADRNSPTRLLNYVTAPDCVIWSALLASAAVPGILNPVVLMQKLKDGTIVPWEFSSKFKDGSLRVDIPIQSLNLFFNVTFPVVSQVNPHVHLFFFAPRGSAGKPVAHSKGKGWRGRLGNFLLSAVEQWLKHELTKNFKVIRDLELLPTVLGQDWSSVFLQRFDGAVTIWPRTRLWDWFRILTDPDPVELERMMKVGSLVTWPKLHMIGNRMRIERQIYQGRQFVRSALKAPAAHNYNHNGPGKSVLRLQPPPALDQVLSVDSDTERAFAAGTRRSFHIRRAHASSGNTTPSGSRKGSTENLNPISNTSRRAEPMKVVNGNSQPFLTRLRTKSFPNFRPREGESMATSRGIETDLFDDQEWSSDSEDSQ
uniref:Patatin-like phospholipase domain-containing protein n=1 Tax=Moniliophthora roreri TaxID=221103 RepID=A0A0W0FJR1_MONRR